MLPPMGAEAQGPNMLHHPEQGPVIPPPPPQIQVSKEFQQQQQLHAQLEAPDDFEDEPCGGHECCPVPEPVPESCNCEAVEIPGNGTATSSERSSSYNSCTLPLKPLKGILKKSNTNQLPVLPTNQQPYGIMQTLPRDLHQMQPQYDLVEAEAEIIPFDQMPPCDDCLNRARHRGSYGDVCQNLEMDQNCGFQVRYKQYPQYRSMDMQYCCKHDRPNNVVPNNLGSLQGGHLQGSNPMMVISRQNSFNEKEEVEAVESSV